MTGPVFIKHYSTPKRTTAARAHRDWVTGLESGVRVPALRSAQPSLLVFEHLGHRRPGRADLGVLAQALGQLHAAAHTRQLHAARLDEPFTAPDGLVIPDFVSPRRKALDQMPLPVAGMPVAFYKDANIRNFLLTDHGAALLDFDDLTLAPFGYDLAKLLLSTAMTHGRPDPREVWHALEIYNTHTAQAAGHPSCPPERLRLYTEFHHLLTARYLHHHGYRHPWPQVRPWPTPEIPR